MKQDFSDIHTSRLTLRKIIDADLKCIYKGLSDPEVVRFYGVSYDSLEETKQQMKWYRDLESSETGIWWSISDIDSGEFIGAAGLNNIMYEHRKGEVGFWLLPEKWGNGYATEAVAKILAFAFEKLKLHRIEAIVETENVASACVLNKLGFRKEGTMQDSEIKDGRYISLEVYALID